MFKKSGFLFFILFAPSCFCMQHENYLQEEYHIAKSITRERGKALIISNIQRDHSGQNKSKSYFYDATKESLEKLINEAVASPTSMCIQDRSGNFMIVKDFLYDIGVHITFKGDSLTSNRLLLFFKGVDKVQEDGQSWNFSLGALVTGFPGNPTVSYK